MADLLTSLLQMYIFISVGLVLGKLLGDRREKILQFTTKAIIFGVTPVLVFISLVNTEIVISPELVLLVITVQLVTSFAMMGIVYLLSGKFKEVPSRKLGGYFLIAMFPNATIFPLPIVISVFGEQWITIIFIFSSSALVLRGTLGTYLSIKHGSAGESADEKPTVTKTILQVITFPPTLAIIVALVVLGTGIPMPTAFLSTFKSPFSLITSVFGAIIIGLILAGLNLDMLRQFKRDVPVAMLLRFVFPLVIFLLVLAPLIEFPENDAIITSILLLEVTGPPAIFNALYAVNFNLDRYFVATMVVTLTLLMLIVTPLLLVLAGFLFNF